MSTQISLLLYQGETRFREGLYLIHPINFEAIFADRCVDLQNIDYRIEKPTKKRIYKPKVMSFIFLRPFVTSESITLLHYDHCVF
jgi:hypothetical protein